MYDVLTCSGGVPSFLVLFLDCGVILPSKGLDNAMSAITCVSLPILYYLLYDSFVERNKIILNGGRQSQCGCCV